MSAGTYRVSIVDTGESFTCSSEQTVLKAMEALGRKGIPVGCRGGGCGVCKVQIESGQVRSRKMSRAHVSEEEELAGVVLACRSYPRSDLVLTVLGKMRKNLCAIRVPEWPQAWPNAERKNLRMKAKEEKCPIKTY